MSLEDYLRKWLIDCLGISNDINPSKVEHFMDGRIFVTLLKKFKVITSEYFVDFCENNNSFENRMRNLRQLSVWFKMLTVSHDEKTFTEIAAGNTHICFRLLYELYISLENNETLLNINNTKIEKFILDPDPSRFKIEEIKLFEGTEAEVWPGRDSSAIEEHPLLKGMGKTEDFRERYKKVLEMCEENRRRIKGRVKIQMETRNCLSRGSGDESRVAELFQQEVAQFTEATKYRMTKPTRLLPTDDYVSMLKARRRKYKAHQNLQERMGSILLQELLKNLFEAQDTEFNIKLAEKLIKQSEYEKETAFKLSQIQYQHKVCTDHAMEMQRLVEENSLSIETTHPLLMEYREGEEEKTKLAELHRRLYEEKVKREEEQNRLMCLEAMQDVVDFAIKKSRLQNETNASVPKKTLNEWKTLFYEALPLFEAKSDEELLQHIDQQTFQSEEDVRPYEEIEIDVIRASAIMTLKLENYLLMLGEWTVEYWPELPDEEGVQYVLGYIVHRLLEFKYPLSQPAPPADIPRCPVASILNGVNDPNIINKLQRLLDKSGVTLIDVNKAVKHVVHEYQSKSEPGEIEDSLKKNLKKKSPRKVSSSIRKTKSMDHSEILHKDEMVQVPEESQIDLAAVTLGKEVVKILTEGDLLPDPLLVDILIEYIKSLDHTNGWVLLNYPLVCSQVAILEFKLGAVEAPILCRLDASVKEFLETHSVRASEALKALRTSRLVPRPNEQYQLPKFSTYFTSFITLEKEENSKGRNDKKVLPEEKLGPAETSEDLIPPEAEGNELAAFYREAGIYTLFTYHSLDVNALKKLGRIILNQETLNDNLRQPSIELFGREVLEYLGSKKPVSKRKEYDKRDSGPKKKQIVQKGPLEKDKRRISGNTNEMSIKETPKRPSALSEHDPTVQEQDVTSTMEEAFLVQPERISIYPPQPGALDWKYSNFPIPSQVLLLLADLWNCIESNYMKNIKVILYHHKVQNQKIMPYRNYVRTIMRELVESGDSRQDLVNEFQDWFNNIDEDMRSYPEMKAELHCRVFEFQNSLWRFCDDKKNTAESMRQAIIRKNWLAEQMHIICNIYMSLVQIEIDRFIDTLKLVQFYYLASLSKPLDETNVPKIEVPRLKRPDSGNFSFKRPESDLNQSSSSSTFSKFETSRSNSSNQETDGSLKKSINTSKRHRDPITNIQSKQEAPSSKLPSWTSQISNSPLNEGGESEGVFHPSLIRLLLNAHSMDPATVTSFHNALTDMIKGLCGKVDTARNMMKITIEELKEKERKMSRKSVKRWSKSSVRSSKNIPLNNPIQSKDSSNRDSGTDGIFNMLLEWETAVDNEADRALFRLRLIRCRALEDLNEAESIMVETFKTIYEDVFNQYNNGIANIEMLCNVFKAAIEEEVQIQPKLMLDLDRFYVLKDVLVFPPTTPPPPTPIMDIQDRFLFTIEQLRNLADLMKRVSPVGIIKAPFVDILSDIALFGEEEGRPCLPPGWSEMSHQDLETLVECFNGPCCFVDWKDFLIRASNIPFPTVEELIEAREEFTSYDQNCTESISREDYQKILLWFEKDLEPSLSEAHRRLSAKDFFFDLFMTGKNQTNYTALLLAFCKDDDPVEGFGKALSLMTGLGYILTYDRAYLEELGVFHEEAETIGKQLMLQLIWDVMEITEGVVIKELEENTEESLGSIASEGKELYKVEELLDNGSVLFMSGEEEEGLEEGEKEGWEYVEGKEESCLLKKDSVKWSSMVPYNLVFTLLLISLHFYALGVDHLHYQISFETLLRRAYREKGQHDLIKAYDLIKSECMKHVFDQSYRFRIIDVSAEAQRIVGRKHLSSTNL